MARPGPKNKLLLVSWLFIGLAVAILVVGVSIAWKRHYNGRQFQQSASTDIRMADESAPSTEKPTDDAFKSYHVAPDAPRYILIPTISVRARVTPVGVSDSNHIESPRNVFDTGWFMKSAKPGQPGAMVIDGHVSSWETNGVFYELKNLKKGDEIQIERGDGAIFTYKVVKSQTYDSGNVDMVAILAPIHPDKPGLNLISCTGSVMPGTNNFNKRIVVFAEQL